MDESYSQVACKMIGLKLMAASKLPEAAATDQLVTVSKEVREALITLGKRTRKTKKEPATEPEKPAKKKGGR